MTTEAVGSATRPPSEPLKIIGMRLSRSKPRSFRVSGGGAHWQSTCVLPRGHCPGPLGKAGTNPSVALSCHSPAGRAAAAGAAAQLVPRTRTAAGSVLVTPCRSGGELGRRGAAARPDRHGLYTTTVAGVLRLGVIAGLGLIHHHHHHHSMPVTVTATVSAAAHAPTRRDTVTTVTDFRLGLHRERIDSDWRAWIGAQYGREALRLEIDLTRRSLCV